jgi:hypothetical protein
MAQADLHPGPDIVRYWKRKLVRLFKARRRPKPPTTLEWIYEAITKNHAVNPQWPTKIGILTALTELCQNKDVEMFDGVQKTPSHCRWIYYEGEDHWHWEYSMRPCMGYRWAMHKRGGIERWNALRRILNQRGKLAFAGHKLSLNKKRVDLRTRTEKPKNEIKICKGEDSN